MAYSKRNNNNNIELNLLTDSFVVHKIAFSVILFCILEL